jgi:hypothetical protein
VTLGGLLLLLPFAGHGAAHLVAGLAAVALVLRRAYSFRAASGPVMRASSGNVAPMTPRASTIPAAVMT